MFFKVPSTLIYLILFSINILAKSDSIYFNQFDSKYLQTILILSKTEEGNLDLINEGIETTERLLKKNNSAIQQKILFDLNKDFKTLFEISHDTFYGVFPIAKFLNIPIFIDNNALLSYELIDDPAEVAVSRLGERFIILLDKLNLTNIQYFLDINTEDYQLKNEFERVILSSHIINIYPNYLNDYSNTNNNLISLEISKYFQNSVFTNINIEGFFKDALGQKQHFKITNIIRDKTSCLLLFIVLNIILFIFIVFIFSKLHNLKFQKVFLFGVLGFIIGKFIPFIAIFLLINIKPLPDSIIHLSFWWIILYGLLILFFIPFLFKVLIERIVSAFNLNLGVGEFSLINSSMIFSAIIVIFEFNIIYDFNRLFLIIVSIIPINFFIKKLNELLFRFNFSTINLLTSFIFPILLIIALTSFYPILYFVSISFLYIPIILELRKKESFSIIEENSDNTICISIESIDELIKACENPVYYKFEFYNLFWEEFKQRDLGLCSWIFIKGEQGTGKSAVTLQLAEDVKNNCVKKSIILKGGCLMEKTESVPFTPFKEAFSNYLDLDVFNTTNSKKERISKAFEGLIDNIIPFSGFLLPTSENNSNYTFNETLNSVKEILLKISLNNKIILIIEDVQWIDEYSLSLINYLYDEFPPDSSANILFIINGRAESDSVNLLKIKEVLNLSPFTNIQQKILLSEVLNFGEKTSDVIINHLGKELSSKNNLHWLFHISQYLAKNNYLERDGIKFSLKEEIIEKESLPLPDNYTSAIINSFLVLDDEQRNLLIFAACYGKDFDIKIVAEAIGMEFLSVLHLLQEIEKKSEIIYENLNKEGFYSFHSSHVLNSLKNELKLFELGPKCSNVPQISREYFGLTASAFEKYLYENSNYIYQIATLYYFAGKRYVKKCIQFSLDAAKKSVHNNQYNLANNYLMNLLECYEIEGINYKTELDYIRIICDKTHLSGEGYKQSAVIIDEYLELIELSSIDITDLLLFSRTYLESGNYEKVENISKYLVNNTEINYLKAEGYLYLALSLSPKNTDVRIENLKKGLELVEGISSKLALSVFSKLSNALAEELVRKSEKENNFVDYEKEVLRYFNNSISIKENNETKDNAGLARSYGGLGRFYLLKNDEEATSKAIEYFIKDLFYAELINDKTGKSIANSFLGKCFLLKKELDKSISYYQNSLNFAERESDKAFAYLGLIENYLISGNINEVQQFSKTIYNLTLDERFSDYIVKELNSLYLKYGFENEN